MPTDAELLRREIGLRLDAEKVLKQRTQAMVHALAQAQAAAGAKSEFLAVMSHELRTPLHGILGAAQLLAQLPVNDEMREYVRTIEECGNALLTTVNDVLDFSKIEAGRMTLEWVNFSLPDLLEGVRRMFELDARRRKLRFEIVCAPDMPKQARSDATRLRQILFNLIGNALKFTPQGEVTLKLEISGKTPEGADLVTMTVQDTGIGIPPDRMDRLFQPFTQTASAITRRYGGSGLGLAISAKLATALGGTLTATSTIGKGSAFVLRVPLAPPKRLDASDAASDSQLQEFSESIIAPAFVDSAAAREPKVLLVEDNELNRMVATRLLAQLGCRVDEAPSGMEALSRVSAGEYDLIFMDMQMPDMSGVQVCRSIRSMDHLRQPRIVAMTANVSPQDQQACAAAGMNGFLAKPFTKDQLRAVVRHDGTGFFVP